MLQRTLLFQINGTEHLNVPETFANIQWSMLCKKMPKARRNKRHTVLERKYRLTCIISSYSFWKVPLLSSHWMWDIMVVGAAIGRISWECSKYEKGLLLFLVFKCLCPNTLLWAELWPLSRQILWSWQALWCPYIFLKLYEPARSLSLPLLP